MSSSKSKLKSHVILRYRFLESALSTSIQDKTNVPGGKELKKKHSSVEEKDTDLKRGEKRLRYIWRAVREKRFYLCPRSSKG